MLDQAYPSNKRKITLSSAPINVEAFLNQRGNDRFVHLVNYSADKREGHVPQVQDFWPASGIKVRVQLTGEPGKVTLVPENRDVQFTFQNGVVSFEAEPLLIHSVYRIQTEK